MSLKDGIIQCPAKSEHQRIELPIMSKVFAKLFEQSYSVFAGKESLNFSYIPKQIFCRDDEITYLFNKYRFTLDANTGNHIIGLIVGQAGVGKTLLAKFFGRNMRSLARNRNISFHCEYFNCAYFKKITDILRRITGRGYSKKEMLFRALNSNKGHTLWIIDDIGLLKRDVIEELLNIEIDYKQFCEEKNYEFNFKLSLLLISRNKDWQEIQSDIDIDGKINFVLKIKPYSREEIEKILSSRFELAFKKGVVFKDGKIDPTIVEYVANCNMNLGMKLLYHFALELDIKEKKFLDSNEIIKIYRRTLFNFFLKDLMSNFIAKFEKIIYLFRSRFDRGIRLKYIIIMCNTFCKNIYNLEFPNLISYSVSFKVELTEALKRRNTISIEYLKRRIIPYQVFFENLAKSKANDLEEKYLVELEKYFTPHKNYCK